MTRNQVLSSIKENHPAGAKLVEVSKDELMMINGGGDVQPETTPLSPAIIPVGTGIATGIAVSKYFC